MIKRRVRGRLVRLQWAGAVTATLAIVSGGTGTALASGSARSPWMRPEGRAAAGIISTVAGGVGGPGKATKVSLMDSPAGLCGVSVGAGKVYIGDNYAVRELNPQTDWLTTPAGTGEGGPLGDGGPAIGAGFDGACVVAADTHGNLVISDARDHRVRVVAATTGTFYGQAMTAGDVYAVAGNGAPGFSGDGGPATSAELNDPHGVTEDSAGNLVIADTDNERVRVVAATTGTFYGQPMIAGDIYTVAGSGAPGFSGDGGPATSAELFGPLRVAVDAGGNLVIADSVNNRVRVVAAATGTFYGQAMIAGDIYTVAGDGSRGFAGDGGPATSAELWDPAGVALDGAGNLVIADPGNHRVRVVAAATGTFYEQAMTAGDIYTVAGDGTGGFSGDGGPATAAELGNPSGVAVDAAGNLVIADTGRVRVVAAGAGTFYGRAMTGGDVYTVADNGTLGFSGDGGRATRAQLNAPDGVAVDGAGNQIIADTGNDRVRVVAAAAGTFYGRAMTRGDVYTVAGDGTPGFSGDGGRATGAELNLPEGVAPDSAGNLVIADSGNYRVRVVAASTGTLYGRAMTAGDIYTVAGNGTEGFSGDGGPGSSAELSTPYAVAVDGAGNLVIADPGNNRIRVVAARTGTFYGKAMTAGRIYTVAGNGTAGFSGDGGPAASAELWDPAGMAVDGAGNLVIADSGNNRIRVVAARTGTFYGKAMTARDIYTVAGTGTAGTSGDGGPATKAEFGSAVAVTVDGAGNLVISDQSGSLSQRVRVVAARTGTFYGKAMTARDIYTVAGGIGGFSGDGGAATAAGLAFPAGLAVNSAGNLLIADSGNDRIRMVTR